MKVPVDPHRFLSEEGAEHFDVALTTGEYRAATDSRHRKIRRERRTVPFLRHIAFMVLVRKLMVSNRWMIHLRRCTCAESKLDPSNTIACRSLIETSNGCKTSWDRRGR